MFSRALQIIGLLAIVIAPAITFLVPRDVTGQIVAAQVSIKDLVLLGCIAILGSMVFLAKGLRWASRLLREEAFYQRVEYAYFYQPDGTVITRTRFDLVNGWQQTSTLPPENLIWHSQITYSDVVYRLYARGKFSDRKIQPGSPRIEYAIPDAKKSETNDYRYSWYPAISPELHAKEAISYVVEITADSTEKAAFDHSGTRLGFGLDVLAMQATITAYAPFGHRFHLTKPAATVRDSRSLEEIPNSQKKAPVPKISPDGTILTLSVKRPKAGRRYWVHYRFEKL